MKFSMKTHHGFVAYAPRAGLRCAVVYFADQRHVYGWFIGRGADARIHSRYFMLEDFYTALATRYHAVHDGGLHSRWLEDDERCHDLARVQETFAREWLLYRADPTSAAQLRQYAEAELAAGELTVRFDKLNRLQKGQADWTWYSPACEHAVLKYLARRWPLDYTVEGEAVAG